LATRERARCAKKPPLLFDPALDGRGGAGPKLPAEQNPEVGGVIGTDAVRHAISVHVCPGQRGSRAVGRSIVLESEAARTIPEEETHDARAIAVLGDHQILMPILVQIDGCDRCWGTA
jgi:hypothetical protein